METATDKVDSGELTHRANRVLRAMNRTMSPSRLSSWHWCREDFRECYEHLLSNPRELRKGKFLSDTPGKEVWLIANTPHMEGLSVIYKNYDMRRLKLEERMGHSLAFREAENFMVLKEIGIPVSDVLACGENRRMGLMTDAYTFSVCIEHALDGSVLMPTGNLGDQQALRISFCKKCMEHIAIAHLAGCYHSEFRAHKILFDVNSPEDDPHLTWIDVATCQFHHHISPTVYIPADLVRMFVDLRLSTKQIKEQCEWYLQCNRECDFTVDSLWEALTKVQRF